MKTSKLIDLACIIIAVVAGMMLVDGIFNPLPTPVQGGLYAIFAILVFCMALFIKHLQIQHGIRNALEMQKH